MVLSLLKKLVQIESPSGNEEEIKSFVKNYLEKLGYDVSDCEDYVAINTDSNFLVSTHLDTVRVKREFDFDGVYAYGTGVCDAKASIAAMLKAAESVDYCLAFFCDEEEGGKGSKSFAKDWDGGMAVIMEPTSMHIASTHYGSIDLVVEIYGRKSHASIPEAGENAIEKAFELMIELKKNFTISPLKIEGGGDEYIIPDLCRIKFDVLLSPESDVNSSIEVIKSIAGKYGNVIVEDAIDGFYSGEVATILERAISDCGFEVRHTFMPSWTDALNLKRKADVVVWGPGDLKYCHTEREKVKLEDIEKAVRVLVRLNELL
ncbi:Acetylornithine deacetylase/Succinyl-diaminopimelate desuccinylase-related deacylase [Archaeoglobus sulfaticallidus PM70-1]|uniref:Acetylornithine deacetylase/Succinyl-diaminopimelate desuccinylase-related deacylase n=1 Tax=Archaeoglobus sulfaticallidus PM70-1 TaxID=387631 RepID=N0BCQ6_9EURY|nr:M20/M25/M40 family metallo-hydrolase [Archaeoglobus sulfaticallidus]AGK60798.1 Acetylornithine deacetylase/Succinyl-diaminopimelate desuccinylase-related deacylase [Archaeoglobus sulfaticallidus PM70-1]